MYEPLPDEKTAGGLIRCPGLASLDVTQSYTTSPSHHVCP